MAEMSSKMLPRDALGMLELLTNDLNEIRKAMTCGICVKTLYEPYTTSCGHTFCYRCLSEWFGKGNGSSRKKTCPDCRAEIRHPPSPAYLVRSVAHMFSTKLELLGPGESPNEHEQGRAEEAEHLEADKSGRGLFPNCFRQPERLSYVIHDVEDGVDRCPECSWELRHGTCSNTNCTWEDPLMASSSDEDSSGEDSVPHVGHPNAILRYHGPEDEFSSFDSDEDEDDTDPGSLDDFVVDEDEGNAPIDLRSESDASASHPPSQSSNTYHSDSDFLEMDDQRSGHPRIFRFRQANRNTSDSPVRQIRSRRITGDQTHPENEDRRQMIGQAHGSEAGDSTAGSDQIHPYEYRYRARASSVPQSADHSDVTIGSFSDSAESVSSNPSAHRSSPQPRHSIRDRPQTGLSRGGLRRAPAQIHNRQTAGSNANSARPRSTPIQIHEISSDSDDPVPIARTRRRRAPPPQLRPNDRQIAPNTDTSSSTLVNERHGSGHLTSGSRPRIINRPETSRNAGSFVRSPRIIEAGQPAVGSSLPHTPREDPNMPGAFPPSFNQPELRNSQLGLLPDSQAEVARDSVPDQLFPHRGPTDRASRRSPGIARIGASGPPHDRNERHARKAARRIERERVKAEQEARRG